MPALSGHDPDRLRLGSSRRRHHPRWGATGRPGGQARRTLRRTCGPPCCGVASRRHSVDPERLYITNAVKHFKHETRGKRRLHKKPTTLEAEACHPWLEAELEAVRAKVVVALGAGRSSRAHRQADLGDEERRRDLRGNGRKAGDRHVPPVRGAPGRGAGSRDSPLASSLTCRAESSPIRDDRGRRGYSPQPWPASSTLRSRSRPRSTGRTAEVTVTGEIDPATVGTFTHRPPHPGQRWRRPVRHRCLRADVRRLDGDPRPPEPPGRGRHRDAQRHDSSAARPPPRDRDGHADHRSHPFDRGLLG